jgi:hypothetical protein
MNYRILGKTGLKISEIGLGTEYLNKQSKETVISVVKEAVKNGMNYIDIVFNFEDYLKNISEALKGIRNKVYLTHHLGSSEKNGKYKKTRNVKECKKNFHTYCEILNIDYTDILFLHFVREREYHKIEENNGILDLALELKKEGKTSFIGLSTHNPEVVYKAFKNKNIDVIMTQVNIASHAFPKRVKLLKDCYDKRIGLVAMKPFAGGKLLQGNRTVYIGKYQTGGESLRKKIYPDVSPSQCLSYVLSQIGVSNTVPGVKNLEELNKTLYYLQASKEEKDFSSLLKHFQEFRTGECVYCNHCLPCPSDINIGKVMKLFDLSGYKNYQDLSEENKNILLKIKECTECENCVKRCPFDVQIISHIKSIKKFL